MNESADLGNPLGKNIAYVDTYDASLLFPIPRASNRDDLGILRPLPFHGYDIWNAYELSWLNTEGKPQLVVAEFYVPCASENIIESKSWKLYLNSFSQTVFNREQDVLNTIKRDLSEAAGANIDVRFLSLQAAQLRGLAQVEGHSLDSLSLKIETYTLDPNLLSLDGDGEVEEILTTDLFKSNCPMTHQPDWASIYVHYHGPKINHVDLLAYLISYRQHADYHEQCVERIFMDLMHHCRCQQLTVSARFTRRGGLDINPFRSNFAGHPENRRLVRQ